MGIVGQVGRLPLWLVEQEHIDGGQDAPRSAPRTHA